MKTGKKRFIDVNTRKQIAAAVGTESDQAIAARFGVAVYSVWRIRTRLGVSAAWAYKRETSRIKWPKNFEQWIKSRSIQEAAAELGCSESSVAHRLMQVRRKSGDPSPGTSSATAATAIPKIGDRLRSMRKAAQYTQGDLAEKAGVSRQMINYYETGRATPAAAIIENLAAALAVDITSLTGDSEQGIPRRSGRRPADGIRDVRRRTVLLDDETVNWLRELGDGELSLGIRRAAAALRKQQER